jgi:hypothetical protein
MTFSHKLARFIVRSFGTSQGRTSSLLVLVLFSMWLYLLIVRHSVWDLFTQPICCYIGYRLGMYGLIGLIPFGPTISSRLYHKINYFHTLKNNYYRWLFLKEEWFKVEFGHSTCHLHPGHEDSRCETTHVECIAVTIGFTMYIFDVSDLN